jgi:hypothetical protein
VIEGSTTWRLKSMPKLYRYKTRVNRPFTL